MSRIMDEMCDKAMHEVSVEVALEMLKDGMDKQPIAKYTKLSPEEVNELAQKKSV